MNKEQFINEIEKLPVYDAHTHLVGSKLCASDFWEIVHYFWFLRELQGAGYPDDYNSLTEEQRIDAFLPCFNRTKGTGMHYVVNRIFNDLYGLKITDKKSVYAAAEKVKASYADAGWARKAAAAGNIKHTVVNNEEHKNFCGLDSTCVWVPRIDGRLNEAARNIFAAEPSKRIAAAEKEKTDMLNHLADCSAKGAKAFMTTLGSFDKKIWQDASGRSPAGLSPAGYDSFESLDDCYVFMLHIICAYAENAGANIQFFIGIEQGYFKDAAPVNNSKRVLNLYGLFEKYKINFDLVAGTEGNNLDVVQAAHIFRNVFVGGMWWFNFRPSTYTDAMAKRFEVLASNKTYLSISDSRCIEWCYGKNTLIKKLAADFFVHKAEEGYVNYEEALEIAADWFYAAPYNLYGR
ncbi:MAG: hypothetical protein FWD78_08995 [Treponema sp.]|nr:hypothetical protein [Treponema sp.]